MKVLQIYSGGERWRCVSDIAAAGCELFRPFAWQIAVGGLRPHCCGFSGLGGPRAVGYRFGRVVCFSIDSVSIVEYSILPMSSPSPSPVLRMPAWGTYAPSGYRRLLRRLATLGVGHGAFKRWLHKQWMRAGAREPVDIAIRGVKFRLQPWDSTIEIKLLLGSGLRDRKELDFLSADLPPDGTFVDVGANVGFYSLMMAARGAARTLAVEPLPSAFQRLQFNVCANRFQDRIVTAQVAVGDARKTALITEAPDLGSSSLVKTGIAGPQWEVPMVPLVDVLGKYGFTKVDAMKVDVEGMEDAVLCPFFEEAPVSLWPRRLVMEDVHRGNWRQNVVPMVAELGYECAGRSRSNVFLERRPQR